VSDVRELFDVIGGVSDADLSRELSELEGRAELIRAALQYRQRREAGPGGQTVALGRAVEHDEAHPMRRPPPQGRRRAVLMVMRENPAHVWAYSGFREELITRGLLENTERANHALGVAMGKMVKDRLLERPERGFYKLAAPDQPALADERGEDR